MPSRVVGVAMRDGIRAYQDVRPWGPDGVHYLEMGLSVRNEAASFEDTHQHDFQRVEELR
jgi:hypothetical protein